MAAGVTPWQSDITKSNCLSCAVLFHVSHKSPLCYSFKVKQGWPRSPRSSCKERDNWTPHLSLRTAKGWSDSSVKNDWRLRREAFWGNLSTAREKCWCCWSVYTVVRGLGVTLYPACHFSLTLCRALCPSSSSSFLFSSANRGKPKQVGDFEPWLTFTENLPMHMGGNPWYFSCSS